MTLTNPGNPHDVPSNGADGPRRRISRSLVVVTAVVMAASGGVGVSAAAAGSQPPPPEPEAPAPTVTVTVTETPAPVPPPTPTPTPPGLTPTPAPTATTAPSVPPLAFPGAMHGEFVLPAEDGCGFTVFAQTGEAITLAEDSLTVRSQDGFEKVYAINDSTRTIAGRKGNEVRQGDWVSVTATTTGETATAAHVFDLSRPSRKFWRGDSWWPAKQWRPGGKWRTPTAVPCPTPPVETPVPPLPSPTDAPTAPTQTPGVPTPEPTPTVTETVPPTPAPTPTP